jgi:hypothetical protein
MTGTILAALAVLTLSVSVANAQSQSYRAPAHNYYQNSWMARGG